MATANESSGVDAIEIAVTDGQEEQTYIEGQYMEFYTDEPTAAATEVSVPHTVSPGGESYAQPIPKDERKKAEVPDKPKNQKNVGRRSRGGYEDVSIEGSDDVGNENVQGISSICNNRNSGIVPFKDTMVIMMT